jgi:hypothetical protein
MRKALLGVVGILLGGCSLGSQSEIIGLNGRTLSAPETEAVRQTCPRDNDKWCLTARGYASVPRDDAAAVKASLLQNAEDNKRKQEAAAPAKEGRKRQIARAPENKKKVAGSNPAPATNPVALARVAAPKVAGSNHAPPTNLYDNVLCRHLALKGAGCPATLGTD